MFMSEVKADHNMAADLTELNGTHYLEFLKHYHSILQPRTYLEIGSRSGDSLKMSNCASIAIDPLFDFKQMPFTNKDVCMLFQMSSDKFFRTYSPKTLFGLEIDMAFLDGLHLSQFLLRDFINVEKSCNRNSIIMLHDCLPLDEIMTRRRETDLTHQGRSQHPHMWTGDVWKVPIILKKHRPDLVIIANDAYPTGMVLITNLNPSNAAFSDKYGSICKEMDEMSINKIGILGIREELRVVQTSAMETIEDISTMFWL